MGNDYYKILAIPKMATTAEIRNAFRRLARKHHPDKHANACAADQRRENEQFRLVNEAYQILSEPAKRKHYDMYGHVEPTIVSHRDKRYQVLRTAARGDLADIHEAVDLETNERVALKVCRDAANNDLMMAERETLKAIGSGHGTKESRFTRLLPALLGSFPVGATRRQVNVLEWLDHWWRLEQVRVVHSPGVAIEHAAWMLNRILATLSYIHGAHRVVHGAVTPAHVLAFSSDALKDPRNHGTKLVDWCYAVPLGEKVKVIAPAYRPMYAPEILRKMPTSRSTDIYMAAKSIIYVLGGDVMTNETPPHVPAYFNSFLRGCVLANPLSRPSDAAALHEEFKEHLRKHYGPKRYVRFDMPVPN